MNFFRKVTINDLNIAEPLMSVFVVEQEIDSFPFPRTLHEFSYQYNDKIIKILFEVEHSIRVSQTEVSFRVEDVNGEPTTFEKLSDTSLIFDVMFVAGEYLLHEIGVFFGKLCYRTKSAAKQQSFDRNSHERGYYLINLEEITDP